LLMGVREALADLLRRAMHGTDEIPVKRPRPRLIKPGAAPELGHGADAYRDHDRRPALVVKRVSNAGFIIVGKQPRSPTRTGACVVREDLREGSRVRPARRRLYLASHTMGEGSGRVEAGTVVALGRAR